MKGRPTRVYLGSGWCGANVDCTRTASRYGVVPELLCSGGLGFRCALQVV